jgi:hypothetical protein
MTHSPPPRPAVPYDLARSGSALASTVVTLSTALRRDGDSLPERERRQLATILDRLEEGHSAPGVVPPCGAGGHSVTDRRRQFLGQQVVRLMTKTCLANDLGQAAFTLLAVVSAQQDAAWGRPVSFFNSQLLPLVGIRKWDTLATVRKACIDAGWLRYEQPGSGYREPGVYEVVIPPRLAHLTDSRCDEEAYPPSGDAFGGTSPINGHARGDAHGDAHGESPPSPSPSFSLSQACDGPEKPSKPQKDYPPEFEEFWAAYSTRNGRRSGKANSFTLWKKIPAADRPAVLAAAENFSRSKQAGDDKARDPERFLKNDWWRDWVETSAATQATSIYQDLE